MVHAVDTESFNAHEIGVTRISISLQWRSCRDRTLGATALLWGTSAMAAENTEPAVEGDAMYKQTWPDPQLETIGCGESAAARSALGAPSQRVHGRDSPDD